VPYEGERLFDLWEDDPTLLVVRPENSDGQPNNDLLLRET